LEAGRLRSRNPIGEDFSAGPGRRSVTCSNRPTVLRPHVEGQAAPLKVRPSRLARTTRPPCTLKREARSKVCELNYPTLDESQV
jgi:hypothetical protein